MSSTTNSISFDELVKGRSSTVRVTADSLLYAVDLVVVVTGKNKNDSARVIKDLSDDIFSRVSTRYFLAYLLACLLYFQQDKFIERQLSSRGGYPTKLLSFQDAIELIMVIPGKIAATTRAKFADILTRYMAGDQSLVEEIQANALSTSPIAQLARGGDGGASTGSSLGKRPPSMHLIRREFKKTRECVLAAVETHDTQTNAKMDVINKKMNVVATAVVNNVQEFSTLTRQAQVTMDCHRYRY